MSYEEKQLEWLILNDFMLIFSEIEKSMKKIFTEEVIKKSGDEKKYRLYYYLGWKSEIKYIDYDTQHIKIETKKFDETKCINVLTLNDIIKLNKNEFFLDTSAFNLTSCNNKLVEINFSDAMRKVIQMRNKIAHNYSEAKISDKEVVEVLQKDLIKRELISRHKEYEEKIAFDALTEKSIHIYSNVSYLNRIRSEIK